jgi:hypothetical protein
MSMNLLRISKIDTQPGFPLKACTLYKCIHVQKHYKIFVRLGSG